MPGGQGGASVAEPISILMSPTMTPTAGPSVNLTKLIEIDSLTIEETGNHGPATMSFNWKDGHVAAGDVPLAFAQLRGPNQITCSDNTTGELLFRGYVKSPHTVPEGGIYGKKDMQCNDNASRLDTLLVTTTVRRGTVESDKARLQWFMSTFGGTLSDWSKVQVLDSTMFPQTFTQGITLREGIEQILGGASDSFQYFMDYVPRIWTWDKDNPRTFPAPFDIVDTAPGAGECNAEADIGFTWDTGNLWTFYNVQAHTSAFNLTLGDNDQIPKSLWYNGAGSDPSGIDYYAGHKVLDGPYGVDLWGLYERTIQAPDADTPAKALKVLRAALRDTRNPVPRGTFSLEGSQAVGWHGGQQVYVKSAVHGLNGRGTDAGPYAGSGAGSSLQPFGIARLTTSFLNGGATRRVTVEFGYRRVLYTG